MSIEGKEKIGHVTITLVEQFPVVCFYRMSEQEYEFRDIHEGNPKLSHLSKMSIWHFCLKFFVFVGNVDNWLVLKGFIQLFTTGTG